MSIQRTLATLRRPAIVKRGLLFSVTVGTVLVLINQSDALMSGSLSRIQIYQIILTYGVPYLVSSLSSA